jgi:hypothetical protein
MEPFYRFRAFRIAWNLDIVTSSLKHGMLHIFLLQIK